VSRPAPSPTQLTVQWVFQPHPLAVKQPGYEGDQSSSWHSASLITGITLQFLLFQLVLQWNTTTNTNIYKFKKVIKSVTLMKEEEHYLLGYNILWSVESQPHFEGTYRLDIHAQRIS
jgi:hypothetical protein